MEYVVEPQFRYIDATNLGVPDEAGASSWRAVSFGNFCLLPFQRLLLEANKPIRLGSRALDILIVLVERAGELVSKDELMTRVWPNTFVESGNLKVHISALRKALHDGQNGNRYVVNIPGRGYCFIAPVTLSNRAPAALDLLDERSAEVVAAPRSA
jgi:DNA-binding winged helix-turn-helix (wHTH) protein